MGAVKNMAKRALSGLLATGDWGRVVRAVAKVDVVSFDVFDTLVRRCVADPEDVHDLVARRAMREGTIPEGYPWREERVAAEAQARRATFREEITLDEIYVQVTGLTEEERARLRELEVESELETCSANGPLSAVWDYASRSGKTIVVASDMYLPREVIAEILKSCGYEGYARLYVSAETMRAKRTGSAFDLIREDFPGTERLLHIGDNPRGDFLSPRAHGYDALLVCPTPAPYQLQSV